MAENEDVAATVQRAVTRIVRWAGRPAVRVALLGQAGRQLSGNDVHLLRTVAAQGPVRASDLAAWQGVDKSTVSTQIRRLEERGLVVRRADPADRRAVLFSVTARGRQLRRRMDAAGAALLGESLREWSDRDRQGLADLLDRFSRQLDDEPTGGLPPATDTAVDPLLPRTE
jgi:DNA-binding MarR family transcriptional regulator